MKTSLTKVATVIAALSLISACSTSPTGRNQLLIFPNSQVNEMGTQAFSSMKEELTISNKRTENQYVQCVADAITANVSKDVFSGEWEVIVFDDDQVNAFALPGGKIGVYTGLLKVAKNQHQLAAVIGHEVGHVIAHHGNERMSQSTLINAGQQVVGQVLEANQVAQSKPIMAAIGLGVQVGVQLPYSRAHESEADIIGLELMAKSGFDPQESVTLWQNMEASSDGQRPLEIMSTHPAPQSRINHLTDKMPRALLSYQQAPRRPNCQ